MLVFVAGWFLASPPWDNVGGYSCRHKVCVAFPFFLTCRDRPLMFLRAMVAWCFFLARGCLCTMSKWPMFSLCFSCTCCSSSERMYFMLESRGGEVDREVILQCISGASSLYKKNELSN
ncbi:unnamed protein product [Ectocarpus fasciculatus]